MRKILVFIAFLLIFILCILIGIKFSEQIVDFAAEILEPQIEDENNGKDTIIENDEEIVMESEAIN